MKVVFWILSGVFLIVGLTNVFGGGWGDGPGGAISAADDGAQVLDAVLQFGAAAGFFLLASRKKEDRDVWRLEASRSLRADDTDEFWERSGHVDAARVVRAAFSHRAGRGQ